MAEQIEKSYEELCKGCGDIDCNECGGQNPKDPRLLKYIKQARKEGYDDYQIKEILLKNNWAPQILDQSFLASKITKDSGPKYTIKNQVTVYLDSEILKALEKRAKKNLFNLNEQIEDILRRSCVLGKKIKQDSDNLDDMFVKLFSRKSQGRPRIV